MDGIDPDNDRPRHCSLWPGYAGSFVAKIVLVSAGLGLKGGGSATLGRLLSTALAEIAANSELTFQILHLGSPEPILEPLPIVHFEGSVYGLAMRVLGLQLASAHQPIIIFDHLGPARIQAIAPVRSPYAICLLGIEVWRKPTFTRQRVLEKADLLFAISDHTRRKAMKYVPAVGRASILPLALEDRPPAGAVDRDLLDSLAGDFFLIVGRMAGSERYKGHDELIEAIRLLSAKFPNVLTVVVGEGDDRPRLENRAREFGVAERIRFVGFVSEKTLHLLYRRCLALVMPSRDEGFGLVYLEAMRAEKPCIAAWGGAAEEIVLDGRTGLLVPYGESEALAEALRALLRRPQFASELGAAGRERYRIEFSFSRFKGTLKRHLAGLIGFTG